MSTADFSDAFGPSTGQPDGFNAAWYAYANPDVVASGVDLLTHYQQYGKAEGRQPYENGPGKPPTVKQALLRAVAAMPDDAGNAVLIYSKADQSVAMSGSGAGWGAAMQLLGIGAKWAGQQVVQSSAGAG